MSDRNTKKFEAEAMKLKIQDDIEKEGIKITLETLVVCAGALATYKGFTLSESGVVVIGLLGMFSGLSALNNTSFNIKDLKEKKAAYQKKKTLE